MGSTPVFEGVENFEISASIIFMACRVLSWPLIFAMI